MHRVVTERARHNSSAPNHSTRYRTVRWDEQNEDKWPSRVKSVRSNRENKAYWYKRDASLIGAVERYFMSRRSENWDRIYSDLRHHVPVEYFGKWENYIRSNIKRHTWIEQGQVYYITDKVHLVEGFYVHPERRTLEWNQPSKKKETRNPHPSGLPYLNEDIETGNKFTWYEASHMLKISETPFTVLEQVNGIWYMRMYRNLDLDEIVDYGHFWSKRIPIRRRERDPLTIRELIKVKQLNRYELKRYHLKNSPQH